MYHVVFKTRVGKNAGGITRAAFNDEATFTKWYGGSVAETYEVVEQGVTEERANELCPVTDDLLTNSR